LHVLRSRTRFRRYGGRQVPFLCFARPRLVFGGNECVEPRFHVLRSWSHFPHYLGRRVPFSCFVHPDSFSAVSRGSCLVFMFFALGLVFYGSEGDMSRFHDLRVRTRFGGTEGVGSSFHVLRSLTHFRCNRGQRVLFSYFALSDSF
jgi:hypothetical protein